MTEESSADTDRWQTARKKPVEVEYRGPYTDTDTIETLEGDFEVDEQYIEEHGGYVIIRGIEGEEYPCGLDIFQETYEVGERPEIVCLCGSTRFKEQYRAENRRLTMEGKIVLSVGLFGHADDVEFSEQEKEMLDALHKRKIDLADRIHIINVDGYVGDSTQSEIEYARNTDTDISYLEQPVATDGGTEPGDTSQVTLGGDVRDDDDPDTSEDYTFSRPQCQATTAAGDRCSNPVRRTDGDPDFCPRHYGSDGVERHEDAETSGGESDGE